MRLRKIRKKSSDFLGFLALLLLADVQECGFHFPSSILFEIARPEFLRKRAKRPIVDSGVNVAKVA